MFTLGDICDFDSLAFLSETCGVEIAETPSEFDGKCLHCFFYTPFPQNPDSGRCGHGGGIKTVNGDDTCWAYRPTPPAEENPWNPDPYYFEITKNIPTRYWFRLRGVLTITDNSLENHRMKFCAGREIGDWIVTVSCWSEGEHLYVLAKCKHCGRLQKMRTSYIEEKHRCVCIKGKERAKFYTKTRSKNAEKEIGKSFGNMTVIDVTDPVVYSNGQSFVRYICRCGCGNTVIKRRVDLLDGSKTRGCKKCRGLHVSESKQKLSNKKT